MGEDDIAALSRLIEVASLADGHRALGEHKWLDLVQGGRGGFAGFVARDHGRVIGYAQLSKGSGSNWAIEYVVHPRWRSAEHDLGVELLSAALEVVRGEGGGHVHLWVPKPTDSDDRVAAAVGLHRGRDLFQMRRPLPAERSARISTRAFRPGEDERRWLEVNNAAFHTHPEQGCWTLETISEREAQPWFDSEGLRLYEVEGELAGFCWTKVQEEDGGVLGEIYVIAVAPAFEGRGLGTELVLAGLDHLTRRHVPTAMLYVDRDNEPARALYAKLGFYDDHVDRAYTGDVGGAN